MGALEHVRPAQLPALVELISSDVACTLRFVKRGKFRRAQKSCELVLANRTAVPVSARLCGLNQRRQIVDFGELNVIGNGLGSSIFVLPADASICESIYVEVTGDGIHLRANADIVPKRRPNSWPYVIAGLSLMGLGTIAGGTACFLERPTIAFLDVPQTAFPGTIAARYRTTGNGSGSYIVTTSDGNILESGALPNTDGELPIAIPAKITGQRVNIGIQLSGVFGCAQRDASFTVLSPPAITPPLRPAIVHAQPRIAYFTAHLDMYEGKPTVLASYQASGNQGILRVTETSGKLLGSSPFSHVGTTRILLSSDPTGPTLHTEIEVTGAGKHTGAAIDIPNTNYLVATPTIPSVIAPTNDAGSAPTSTDPFSVIDRVIGGHPFRIAIRHPLPNLRIALQTTDGMTIDEVPVPPGASIVLLHAPVISKQTSLFLMGTYTHASDEETLVRSLTVYPL